MSGRSYDRDITRLVIERGNLCRRLWLKAVQPVKKVHQHLQCILLAGFHCIAKTHPFFLHIWVIFQSKVFSLERDGVVEEELGSVRENIGDSIPGEVPMEGAGDIGEYESNVVGQS